MSLFISILALALPIFLLQVYNRVVQFNAISTLHALLVGVSIVICFDFLLRETRSRMLQWAAVRIDARLGKSVFKKLLSIPLQELERRSTSQWHAHFRDVETVRNTICGPTAILTVELPFAIIFVAVIFVIATPIAWVLLVAIPCFVLLSWRSGKVLENATVVERSAQISRDALLGEVLANRTTVKALALDRSFLPRWEDKHADGIELSFARGRRGDRFVNLGICLAVVTTVALTVFGVLAILDQKLTIGALIATNMLSNRIISPFNQLVGTWRSFAHYKLSLARLDDFFGMASERAESGIELDRPSGEVTLENVSFAFNPNRKPVIDGVRLVIEPGAMVGIVGHNGSGKTTLLKLVHGLYQPNAGRVLLDGADIGQFTRRQLTDWIGYVPQELRLFNGSIRENIAITHPDCSDDEIVAAASLAGVHDHIMDLPDGYASDVGEAGSLLSGGERQRIGIARALLRTPRILLLDEATSNLDSAAQQAMRETLTKLTGEHTIILVSHSPVLLTACSHIVMLDHGRVRMAGQASEILPRMFGAVRRATVEEVKA